MPWGKPNVCLLSSAVESVVFGQVDGCMSVSGEI